MPNQPGGGKPTPKPHVQKHLEKNGVDPARVPGDVITALNDCTDDELMAMRRVADSMEAANLDAPVRVSVVH
jgi:hypothetical protein